MNNCWRIFHSLKMFLGGTVQYRHSYTRSITYGVWEDYRVSAHCLVSLYQYVLPSHTTHRPICWKTIPITAGLVHTAEWAALWTERSTGFFLAPVSLWYSSAPWPWRVPKPDLECICAFAVYVFYSFQSFASSKMSCNLVKITDINSVQEKECSDIISGHSLSWKWNTYIFV